MEKQKYLYAIYDTSDYERVDNIFLELYKNNIPVKSANDTNQSEMNNFMFQSEAVLLVISPAALQSPFVVQQIQIAAQMDKHIIPYYVYDTQSMNVPADLFTIMDGSAAIPAYQYAYEKQLVERAVYELRTYFPIHKGKSLRWLWASGAMALLMLIVIGIIGMLTKPESEEHILDRVRNATGLIYNVNEDDTEGYTGSGFFISKSGLMATNYHVIEECEYIYVKPSYDDDFYQAECVYYDREIDLALLKVDDVEVKTFLNPVDANLAVGQTVYVAGYPRGIDLTVSNGIISNAQHYADDATEYFLITAAISPGNSGGAVVNKKGEVIGIATAKYIDAENVNLARPAKYLINLINQYK